MFRGAKFSAVQVLFSEVVKIPFDVRMKVAKRWTEDFKYAVLVVAGEIGVIVFEMTTIRGRHVVFRVNTLNLGRIVKMLVSAETIADNDRFSDFFLSDAVDGFSPSFVLQYRSTRYEPLSFGGLVFAFTQKNTAIVFDDEIDGDERNVLNDFLPLGRRD